MRNRQRDGPAENAPADRLFRKRIDDRSPR